jgi:hypothetical protein
MNARYQDPVRGQFINEDPAIVGLPPSTGLTEDPNTATVDAFLNESDQTSSAYLNDPQTLNFYSYGRDNPLRYTDPTGQTSVENAAISQTVRSVLAQYGLSSYYGSFASNFSAFSSSAGTKFNAVASAIQNQYQEYSTGVTTSLDHPFQAVTTFPQLSPARKVGIGIGLLGQAVSFGDGGGEYQAAESGISETAAAIAGHASKRFPDLATGAAAVEHTMLNPDEVRLLDNDRVGFLNYQTGYNVIFNPNVGYLGTIFNTLTDPKGVDYHFFNELH